MTGVYMGGGEGVDPSGLKHLGKAAEITAYHEAGHAVACCVFKHEFKTVSIIPGEGFQGILNGSGIPEDFNIDNPGPEEKKLAWEQIIISLAGTASEYRFTGEDNWGGSMRDRRKAYAFAALLDRRVEDFYETAREFISSNWKKVEAVAQALLERHTLSAQQVKEICENQSG
jgi:ATP-dependent Zn protease